MLYRILDPWIRIVISWTLIFAPLVRAHAAPPQAPSEPVATREKVSPQGAQSPEAQGERAPPQTQTAAGGGGKSPPNLPPTKNFDGEIGGDGGSGGGNGGSGSSKGGSGTPRWRPGDIIPGAKSPSGTEVFHTGLKDKYQRYRVQSRTEIFPNGRTRVYWGTIDNKTGEIAWEAPRISRPTVHPGTNYPAVERAGDIPSNKSLTVQGPGPGPGRPDYPGNTSRQTEYLPEFTREQQEARETALRNAPEAAESVRPTGDRPPVRPDKSPGFKWKPGDKIFLEHAPNGGAVYYSGWKNHRGQPMVHAEAKFLENGVVRTQWGTMVNGKITWEESQFRHAPTYGETVPNVRAPGGGAVFYTPFKDPEGRRRVYAERDVPSSEGRFRHGLMEADGRIQWDNAYHSRPPGINEYPNYPAQARPAEPIPSNRALTVPEGSAPRDVPSGPRNYEIVPEFTQSAQQARAALEAAEAANQTGSKEWLAGRPSSLRGTLEWNRVKGERLRTTVHNFMEGSGLNAVKGKAIGGTASIARTGGSFYLAFGILTALGLVLMYPNDPRALQAWADAATDPVFYLSFGGFLAAAAPFYIGMGGHGAMATGPVRTVLPHFAAAMIFGGVVSHLMMEMFYDPNFSKCTGWFSQKKTGKFVKDYAACDALYDKYANYQLDNEIAPLIPDILVATSVFFPIYRVLHTPTVAARIGQVVGPVIRVAKVPPLGVTGLIMVGAATLFMGIYAISSSLLPFGKMVSQKFYADNPDLQYPLRATYDWYRAGLTGEYKGGDARAIPSYINEFGNSINDSETKILTEWKRLQANNWKNLYKWERVCLDSSRNYQKVYNCDVPDQVDVHSVIRRYGEIHAEYRNNFLMKATNESFKSWALKVHNYNGLLAASYSFYKNHIDKLLGTDKKPKRGKSGNTDEKEEKVETPEEFRARINELGAEYGDNYKKAWPNVEITDFYDFMITSMACGPEAERYSQPGWLVSVYRYLMARSPKKMSSDSVWDISFYPPRIVEPIPGGSVICSQPTESGPLSFLNHVGLTTGGPYKPHEFPFASKSGQLARGLEQYILENLRTAVVDDKGQNKFDEWWLENVMIPHEALQEQFRKEYAKMLTDNYVPALENASYHYCEPTTAELKIPSLARHLRELGRASDCQAEATHRMPNGIFNSLLDELRLYSALLMDMLESAARVHGKKIAELDELQKQLVLLQGVLLELGMHIHTVNSEKRSDLAKIQTAFFTVSKAISTVSEKILNQLPHVWPEQAAKTSQYKSEADPDKKKTETSSTTVGAEVKGQASPEGKPVYYAGTQDSVGLQPVVAKVEGRHGEIRFRRGWLRNGKISWENKLLDLLPPDTALPAAEKPAKGGGENSHILLIAETLQQQMRTVIIQAVQFRTVLTAFEGGTVIVKGE
ncbi:MAG: hypothetical protein AB7G93_03085 [Bdellovibrionales bacterium]